MRIVASLLLALLAVSQAAAWDCPGGVKGTDQVTGYSTFFGIKEEKPLKYIDQITAWKKFGPITKINMYYSYTFSCIQGMKVTYGYDSKNAQLLGGEQGLTSAHILLAPYEHIDRVEIKQGANKCIEYIKLTTNKGQSASLGNYKSASPIQVGTPNKDGGFLAAVRGYEDYTDNVKGGMQQLQFVWGIAVCPAPPVVEQPEVEPEEPAVEPEVPEPVDEPVDEPEVVPEEPEVVPEEPEVMPEPEEPFCPPQPSACSTDAANGQPGFCSAAAPFVSSQCVGGCCVSTGKCRKGFCAQAGLGAEVFAADMLCWGTNGGHGSNRCRNLACKLAVPGCVSDLLSGSCVGSVVALSNDLDADAAKWVGYPCLQTVPGGLPIDAAGGMDVHGPYAAKLWSVCNCKANKGMAGYSSSTCKGPMCSLFKMPELPSMNFAMPNFKMADMGPMVDLNGTDWKGLKDALTPKMVLPKVSVSIPDMAGHFAELKERMNTSGQVLNPILGGLFSKPGYPSFTVNMSKPELPTLSVHLPMPASKLNESLPTFQHGKGAANTRTFDLATMNQTDHKELQGVLRAFNVQG